MSTTKTKTKTKTTPVMRGNDALFRAHRDAYIRRQKSDDSIARLRGRKGEFDLLQWRSVVRQSYWSGAISAERLALVEEIPGWSWGVGRQRTRAQRNVGEVIPVNIDPPAFEQLSPMESRQRAAFASGLAALLSFQQREGHLRIPLYHQEGVVMRLECWAARKRTKFRRGELPDYQLDALNEVPGWSWEPEGETQVQNLVRLGKYLANKDAGAHMDLALNKWVTDIRRRYRENRIGDSLKAELDATPGWNWVAPRVAKRLAA